MKVVVNSNYGGFELSRQALRLLRAKGVDMSDEDSIEFRSNPILVKIVEDLPGLDSGDGAAVLTITEIPEDVGMNWHINEYDGWESIHENHRSW